MNYLLTRIVPIAMFVFLLTGTAVLAAPQKTIESPAPPPHPGAVEPAEPSVISGKVVETMNAGGYTYICLEKNGKKTWLAVPETKVTVGAEMSFLPGTVMTNFTSKTLNRTFESIVFSSGPAGEQPAGHGAPAVSAKGGGGGSKAASSAKEKGISVAKAEGPSAYTVAEIFSKRGSLNKKTIVVRAKVVKVSAGIMGKNWIHLQDGTGDQSKGTHNLVATSQDLPAVGDVVTVKGKVIKDKDFGAGYKYAVILEEASVQK